MYVSSLESNRCELCQIHKWEDVHHQNYDSLDYENPWNELDEHLIYVCKECHDQIHSLATWTHSTKQEDMNEWLRLLEVQIIEKRVDFEKNREKERIEYEKQQAQDYKDFERERTKNDEIRKKWVEEEEKLELKNDILRRKNERLGLFADICIISYAIIYIYIFSNYIYPYINRLWGGTDGVTIVIFIVWFGLCSIVLLPIILTIATLSRKNSE